MRQEVETDTEQLFSCFKDLKKSRGQSEDMSDVAHHVFYRFYTFRFGLDFEFKFWRNGEIGNSSIQDGELSQLISIPYIYFWIVGLDPR